MAPLIVLIVVTLAARGVGYLGFKRVGTWPDAVRLALAVMFLFTASAHFTPMKHDLAAMIPPPFTGSLPLIYATGLLEIAGAIGLLIPRFQRIAAICLILMLLGLLPANIYAAINGIPFRGLAPTPLIPRVLLQLFWIALLWWSS